MKSLFHFEYKRKASFSRAGLFIIFVLGLITIGCSTAPNFIKPDFEQRQIKSIAIMPLADKRNTSEGRDNSKESISKIENLLVKKFVDKHYDVVSPATVMNVIKEIINQSISHENLCSLLKVDGILYGELYDYSDIFFIKHSLKMSFKINDAKGDSLWVNNVDDIDRPFLTALGASLGWAIGASVESNNSSKNKAPIILAGAAAAELIYAVVDGVTDETSRSIDKAFNSLPDAKGYLK
jgi:hypothetical protein